MRTSVVYNETVKLGQTFHQLKTILMTTGAFSRNVGKLFSKLKLVTPSFMQKPTEKPLNDFNPTFQLHLIFWYQYCTCFPPHSSDTISQFPTYFQSAVAVPYRLSQTTRAWFKRCIKTASLTGETFNQASLSHYTPCYWRWQKRQLGRKRVNYNPPPPNMVNSCKGDPGLCHPNRDQQAAWPVQLHAYWAAPLRQTSCLTRIAAKEICAYWAAPLRPTSCLTTNELYHC